MSDVRSVNKTNKELIVFLGGTYNKEYDWRGERCIPLLEKNKINYFNPIVVDWHGKAKANELLWRENSDFVLYSINKGMEGVYSIAEVVDDSNKRPESTVFMIDEYYGEFDGKAKRSLKAVAEMVVRNGGHYIESYEELVEIINKH